MNPNGTEPYLRISFTDEMCGKSLRRPFALANAVGVATPAALRALRCATAAAVVAAAAMPLRHIEAAARARERELHLERLKSITQGKHYASITQRPMSAAASAAPWMAPSLPKPAPHAPTHGPRATLYSRGGSAGVAVEVRLEQLSHAQCMHDLMRGTARKLEKHRELAQSAGRAALGTAAARRRIQADIDKENVVLRRHIRTAKPKLASPSEIALLTGGRKAKASGGAGQDQDEVEEDGDK